MTEDQPKRGGTELAKPTGCCLKLIPTLQCVQCTLERQVTDDRRLWYLKRRENWTYGFYHSFENSTVIERCFYNRFQTWLRASVCWMLVSWELAQAKIIIYAKLSAQQREILLLEHARWTRKGLQVQAKLLPPSWLYRANGNQGSKEMRWGC